MELWAKIQQGETPGWKSGEAFEYLVLRAFQLEGAEVQWPYTVEIGKDIIEQIDGVVYCDGFACLVESKNWATEKVSIEPIAILRNKLLRRPAATIGIVFSRSGFTDPALTLAQFVSPQTILLWNGDEVLFALEKQFMRQGLINKYRHCVERGLPNYPINLEE